MEAPEQQGQWISGHGEAAELLRVELRRAAKIVGISIRTGVTSDGRVWVTTPDGLPAREPWRGAAQHLLKSGAEDAAAAHVLNRLLRGEG